MKLNSLAIGILPLLANTAFSFVTPFPTSSYPTTITPTPRSTRLFISSWGAKGPPSTWKEVEANPAEKIQSYLKAPEPVSSRANLDGMVLVSGWVNAKERTDQTVYDFLNHEDSAFEFSTITAFVDDAKFAKKRLISRSARYTGLLDKLEFEQAESAGALPTIAQLNGAKSWVANAGGDVGRVIEIVELAKAVASLENVSILLSDVQDLQDLGEAQKVVSALQGMDDGKAYSLVVVGAITEAPEGGSPYQIKEFGTEEGLLLSNATYSRDESLRMVTDCFALASGARKAFVFSEVHDVNQTETKLIRGLREGGYSRPQELDHMIIKGPEEYVKACADFEVRTPKQSPYNEWLLEQQKIEDESSAERAEKVLRETEEKKTKEIEDIAREWARREFYRQSMAGDMPYTEEEYTKSVWERAIFEGDLKYRMMRGQDTDERKELQNFKEMQKKKEQMMLERAKASLQELLDEDDRANGGEDDDDNEE